MKNFLTLILISLIPSILFGQSPQSIPYQAVVRNSDGSAMSSTAMTMTFKIHDLTAAGTIVYQESHSTTSNSQGLVVLQVGQGQTSVGTFDNINWGNGAKFLHVVMNAGNGEVDLGTQQMMSVPYALYAEKSGSSMHTGSATGELMYWNGNGWSSIPPGSYGQALVMCDGVPTWGGCLPRLDGVQVQSIVPSSSTEESNNHIFIVNFKDEIANSGIPGAGNNAFSNFGFYLSSDSLFIENVQNLQCNYVYESGYSSQNPFYFQASEGVVLELSATYYVKAYCQNNFGMGFSQVVSFTTPGSVIIGCVYSQACNYNPSANVDDGSCLFQGVPCDDGDVSTVNDVIDDNCSCVGLLVMGTGAQLLPGNTTCTFEHISVTGCDGQSSLNYDGRTYDLVEIGGQCWFAENLASTIYSNGDPIPTDLANSTWLNTTSGSFSIYSNSLTNDSIYGKLYNWYACQDSRGICPTGWHVPSDCDWMFLESTLGIPIVDQEATGFRTTTEGTMLKSSDYWTFSQNDVNINSTGFTAVPAGYRVPDGTNGNLAYGEIDWTGYWWTRNDFDSSFAWLRSLHTGSPMIFRDKIDKRFGFSVRCLKD